MDITLICIAFFLAFLLCFGLGKWIVSKKLKSISEKINKQKNTGGSFRQFEKNVDEWLKERHEEMERLNQLESYRKEYLGNISHELKTPVFNIQGYVSTLLDGGMDDKKINVDYLRRAEKSVERMIAIVDDLQTITQLEKGELELEEDRFNVIALAQDVLESQELKANESGINLELKNDSSQPVFVVADRFRIRQVLVNLVVNSVRYGKTDGKTLVTVSDAGEKVIIEISDNGIGISKEHLPRVFERFYRVDKSRSRDQGGTGLGLSIVKHIVEAHGETIDVMSTEGAGSVFSFTLKKNAS